MRVIKVSAGPSESPIEVVEVETAYPGLKDLLGGWIERVSTPYYIERDIRLVMVVDEEGRLKNLQSNIFAMHFYPGIIAGDAYFLGEGIVMTEEGPDIDFISLPEDFGIEELTALIR